MNVAIIGKGPHFYRYFDSLCFFDGVDKIDVNPDLKYDYDIVAVTEPFSIDSTMVEKLKNVSSDTLILIEKLPFCTADETQAFLSLMTEHRLFFVHHRLFEQIKTVPQSRVYHIIWPNKSSDKMDPIYHTLPNVIDFCCNWFGFEIDEDKINVIDNRIVFYSVQGMIELEITDEKTQSLLSVNGEYLSWPNYMDTYSQMLKNATATVDYNANHRYLLNEIKLIEKIKSYMR